MGVQDSTKIQSWQSRIPNKNEFRKQGDTLSYKLKWGDTLSKISRTLNQQFKINLSPEQIASQNGIKDPNLIKAGQEIKIDLSKQSVESKTLPEKATSKNTGLGQNKTLPAPSKTGSPLTFTDPLMRAKYNLDYKYSEIGEIELLAEANKAIENNDFERAGEIAKLFSSSIRSGSNQKILSEAIQKNIKVKSRQIDFLKKTGIKNPFDLNEVSSYFRKLPDGKGKIDLLKNYLSSFYYHPGSDIPDKYSIYDMLGNSKEYAGKFKPDPLGRKQCDCNLFASLAKEVLAPFKTRVADSLKRYAASFVGADKHITGYQFEEIHGGKKTLLPIDHKLEQVLSKQSPQTRQQVTALLISQSLIKYNSDGKLVKTENFETISEAAFAKLLERTGLINYGDGGTSTIMVLHDAIKRSEAMPKTHMMMLIKSPDGKSYLLNNNDIRELPDSKESTIIGAVSVCAYSKQVQFITLPERSPTPKPLIPGFRV